MQDWHTLTRNFFTGGDIGRFVQKEVAKIDCWKGNYHETKANLRLGVQICEEWKQLITKKCNVWRHDSLHTWKSPKVPCEGIIYLGNRLKEVKKILFYPIYNISPL